MRHVFLTASVSLLALSASTGATAQSPSTAGVEPGASTVSDVIVTAQRREQAAQDVGIALSVLSGADLTDRGITNINALQTATPNLEIEPAFGGGAAQFRLRGVGFQDYASNNSPTVGVYVNEVAYPVPVMTQGLIFDIDRVEVLRGPQGTLYGRNTTGGAISVVTRQPTAVPALGMTAEYSRFDALRVEGFVSGPLGDRLQGRLAVTTEQGGAWQYNRDTGESIGDANRSAVRGLLAYQAGDRLDLTLDLHAGVDRSENQALYLLNPLVTRGGGAGSVTIPADRDHAATGWGLSPRFAAEIGRSLDARPGRDNSSWGSSIRAVLELDGVSLTGITSYETLDRSEYGDWDSSASVEADTFFGSDVKVFSQEMRLASDAAGPLSWVAGVYYSKQDLDERYSSDFIDIYGTYGQVTYRQQVESISAFGQAEYQLSDTVKLIGGLRYEDESRDLQGFGAAFGGAVALPPTSVSTRMTPLTGKVALEYAPSHDLLIYGSFSRGAKSGGFTTYNTGQSSAIQPFRPEILLAYELGFKADPSRSLQINGAAYLYDYTDQQVLSAVYGANGPVGLFVNVPASRIYGAEIEGVWRPLPNLRISQSLSYKHGEYTDFFDLDVPASRTAGTAVYVDKSGRDIPFPAVSYGGAAAYDWGVEGFDLTAEANYSYRDDYPSWLGVRYDVPAYWLANASLTVSPAVGRWSVTGFVRNLFDQEYDLTRNFFTSADIAQPGRPRTYGIRLGYQY
ncbi:MAG: iron complex outermembrane receptor protein [Brevundimonas sp.]|jgi:iron complex outermembrane receptor protein|uniref:TonB-dependent receptor n=1 Tax=Brevundimonas sp. TaxID=1871086 RepID=UPI0039E449BB